MAEEKNESYNIGKDILKIIEKSVEAGINEGIVRGMKEIEKINDERKQKMYDARKYNTELLLKNYRNFKKHISDSVYSSEQVKKLAKEKEEYKIDFDEPMDDTYIKSILKSKMTTGILLEQIDIFLNYYQIRCKNSKREEIRRRGRVIELLYIKDLEDEEMISAGIEKAITFEDIADMLYISTKTVNRDRKAAIKELSVLLFGIEGLRIKN